MNNFILHLLSLFFGFGSWIAMTGLWVELPLLIEYLPERWTLGSYLNVMIQIANIGPIIYWFVKRRYWCGDVSATHIQFIIGAFSCVFLIKDWRRTFYIFGQERSVILFLCCFGLSIVDCTSSVTFLTFMSRFDSKYLTTYLIGEGLSGFIPTIVALLQGVEDKPSDCHQNDTSSFLNNTIKTNSSKPLFSPEIFFFSLLLTLLLSWISFISLQIISSKQISLGNITKKASTGKLDMKPSYFCLLIIMFWCCISTFGIFPSLQPFSSLPYGRTTLHYVVLVTSVSYPLGCLFAMFFKAKSMFSINILTIFGSLMSFYILTCAYQSPNPIFKQTSFGGILMITSWMLFILTLSYVKTIITIIMSESNGSNGLFLIGMITQFGAAIGAAAIFLVINFTDIFKEEKC